MTCNLRHPMGLRHPVHVTSHYWTQVHVTSHHFWMKFVRHLKQHKTRENSTKCHNSRDTITCDITSFPDEICRTPFHTKTETMWTGSKLGIPLQYTRLLQHSYSASRHPVFWYSVAIFPMRWLRWVGSLKLQVSFAKKPYKKDDILQKRPTILRSLLIVATS